MTEDARPERCNNFEMRGLVVNSTQSTRGKSVVVGTGEEGTQVRYTTTTGKDERAKAIYVN